MQTIKIQNCTDFKDKFFKIIINGEEHVMRHQFLTVFMADDKLFEAKVKYFWGGSPVYTFEPKENLLLQISSNRQLIKTSVILLFVGIVLSLAIGFFFENARFIFLPTIAMLIVPIHQHIRRKKFFIIREIKENES